jgi:hypothetical protein
MGANQDEFCVKWSSRGQYLMAKLLGGKTDTCYKDLKGLKLDHDRLAE